ncbi:hypothetical protein MtrunA17_Chr6g0478931 [Medicago truncatula]|uniref:Uncharacterized protein n=1 Tax=Medicago truncatula TaxID=3880 RepID=A0A396HID5_MEDTR|nr:hypothetical protein MtrunA17_Chr6g0478931 [Medicago truncatula]
MLGMFFFSLGVNQNIVDEHNYEPIQKCMENAIHILHKHSRCIGHTERHNFVFIVTITRSESCLLHILIFYFNLVITRSQINLAENSCTH